MSAKAAELEGKKAEGFWSRACEGLEGELAGVKQHDARAKEKAEAEKRPTHLAAAASSAGGIGALFSGVASTG